MPLAALACVLLVVLAAASGSAQGEGLLELYQRALETNPALRSREFGIEQAKAQEDLARSRLLPQLMISGSYDRNDYNENNAPSRYYPGKRGGLIARQSLLDLASYFRLKGAQSTVTQSEQQREAAEIALGGEVVDRYLTVLQAEDDMVYLQSEKDAIENQLQRLRFMAQRQLTKLTDLYEVEAYYQGLLTREIEATNARAVALERLRETTGVVIAGVTPLGRDTFPPVPGDPTQWTSEAVGGNPNLLALANAIEAARQLIESGRAEHLPRLSLSASQTYSDQGYDNREVPSYRVGTVGIQFSMPIFEGGRVDATVREATAKYDIAREQYEAARREIESNVRSAYLSAIASYARIGSTGEETRALEKVVAAQQRSYELGVTTALDVLIARRRLVKSRSDQSKARYDYLRDLTALRVQVGVLTRRHIEEIDGWLVQGK